jgi:hypothetical protein
MDDLLIRKSKELKELKKEIKILKKINEKLKLTIYNLLDKSSTYKKEKIDTGIRFANASLIQVDYIEKNKHMVQ